jgi:non-specific serine/threonine protein kinase
VLAAPITGYLAAASTAIDAALDRARLPRNAGWLPMTQIWAGMVAARQGDADRAVDLGLAALRAGRRAADDSVVLLSVLLLGPFVTRRPELDRELPTGAEAVELARRCHQPLNEALLLIRLVTRSVVEGDHRQALERAEEMLLLGRAMHGSPAVAFQLLVTQWVVTLAGDVDRAACLFGAVRPTLGFINTYEMPAQRTAREERIDQLRSTLGDEAFESLAARGAAMAPAEAMEFALDAVRDALATLTADHDEQTAVTSRQCDGNSIVLTARQRQILQLLALGLSNKAIAAELRISVKTVMHHTTAIYRKLGVSSRQEAVVHAYRTGMVRAETA